MSVKLHEAVSFDSLQDRLFYFEDFEGDQLKDEWNSAGDAGGSAAVVDAQTGGICRITTDGDTNDEWYIDWGDTRSLLVSKNVAIEMRVKFVDVGSTVQFRLGLFDDWDDMVMFWWTGYTLYAQCEAATVITQEDTGETAEAAYHVFRIECTPAEVRFYIDGTLKNDITTNITTAYLQPFLLVHTAENAAKAMDIDYIYARQLR